MLMCRKGASRLGEAGKARTSKRETALRDTLHSLSRTFPPFSLNHTTTPSYYHIALPTLSSLRAFSSKRFDSHRTTMMLAAPFYAQPLPMYIPTRPSPLSPRSANVLSRPFTFTMAAPSQSGKTPVPQRTHKPNPVMQGRDAVAQRRRDMFFRRVQKGRDDKKWDARGEQV